MADEPARNQLRNARRAQGLTQAELARAIGATQPQISNTERGRSGGLPPDRLVDAADYLGLELATGLLDEAAATQEAGRACCPSAACPSNQVDERFLLVEGEVTSVGAAFLPAPMPRAGGFCALCGTALIDACRMEACGAPRQLGAFCHQCGAPYVEGEISTALARTRARASEKLLEEQHAHGMGPRAGAEDAPG